MATTISLRGAIVRILGLLGALFVGLKLAGFITWSWWWVTFPLSAALAILLVYIAIFMMSIFAKR